MRKFLIAASVLAGLGIGTLASAANSDDIVGQSAKAYMNFGFGGKDSSLPGNFHYGLRLDHDTRTSQMGQMSRPAIMQVDFNAKNGFSSALVNGVPFASHVSRFDEDGSDTSYTMLDWGLLAVGAVGLGFGIAEVLKTKDDPDSKATPTNPTGNTTGSLLGGLLGGLLGATYAGGSGSGDSAADAERQAWLDGGTGQMGDLHAAR